MHFMSQPHVLLHPRLREFPHGLGKGHDCALLGSWLLEECEAVDETSIVPWCLFGLLLYFYGIYLCAVEFSMDLYDLCSIRTSNTDSSFSCCDGRPKP